MKKLYFPILFVILSYSNIYAGNAYTQNIHQYIVRQAWRLE
jgi:hypothetical protein